MVKSISALKNEISTCEKNMQQALSQCASLVGGETNFVFCFSWNNSSTISRCVLKRWVILQIVIVYMFFGYFTNLLHNNMAVIASQIVQDNWFLDFINLSSEVTDITMLMRWPPVLSCGVAAVLTLFYNFFCMIYCKCDILLPVWICVYLHQTFSMVYYSALLLFFCRNQLLLFLPWIYRQHFLLCLFKLASCISHHNNRLLRNHIHSLYVSDMLQCMIHYCLLSGANVWIFSVIISKSA